MQAAKLSIIVILSGLAGCTSVDAAKLARAAKPTPPPLGTLQGREYAVEVYAGPVFTVLSADGEVLAELMTAEQLQASLPEVYRKIERVYAANLASSIPSFGFDSGIDARTPWTPPVEVVPE